MNYWLTLLCLFLTGLPGALATEPVASPEQSDLTPEGLLRSVANFTFELAAQPQDPAVFWQRRRGDCADFAQFADRVLAGRGYHTKLVVVMLEKLTHVVCYVREVHGYLDFNRRAEPHPLVESDGSLEDIAQKVSRSFHCKWHMVSEFRYESELPFYLASVFPPAQPAEISITAPRLPGS